VCRVCAGGFSPRSLAINDSAKLAPPQPRLGLAGSARCVVVGTASRVGPPDKALMSEDQNHGQGS